MRMNIDKEFRHAFATAERYERYKLIKTTGLLVVIIGIGRFLLSWILDQTFLFSLNLEAEVLAIFKLMIQVILFLVLSLTLLYSYFSTKKTSINRGGKIVSVVDIQFGFAICLLVYLTFFLQIIGSVYFEEVLGVFLYYFILRNGIKNDLKELFNLGLVLLIISIIELVGRVMLIFALFGHEVFVPIWTIFYIALAIVFVIPYLIFGLRIIQSAPLILEEG